MYFRYKVEEVNGVYYIMDSISKRTKSISVTDAEKIVNKISRGKLFGTLKSISYYVGGSLVYLKKDNESISESLQINVKDLKVIVRNKVGVTSYGCSDSKVI